MSIPVIPVTRYKVTFQPLSRTDVYDAVIDVSDRVEISGIKNIRKSIDSGDYDIGVYTFDDISIKGFNDDGFFNDSEDSRSMFITTRDRTKVIVEFLQLTLDSNGSEVEVSTISFRGLINEEATRANIITDNIVFRVLSRDSVIRNTKVSSGAITNGTSIKNAMFQILSNSRITSVLGVSLSNINPDLDITIDDGSDFNDKPTNDAINEMALVSNSVMIIDSSDNVIIKSRDEDETKNVLNLFGKGDIHGRENIITITKYNTGQHRMFTSVIFNGREKSDGPISSEFGLRQKSITLPFITLNATEDLIAARLLKEFKAPKIELNLKIPTRIANGVDLLDRVSVNYPLRLKPPLGSTFMPVIGVTKIGSTTELLPDTFGSIEIPDNLAFKVIEITENPTTFETLFKLRQIGTELNDGVFNIPGSAIVGFAIVGEAVLQVDTAESAVATWSPGIVGGGQIGLSKIA